MHGATTVHLTQQTQPVQIQHPFSIATHCYTRTRDRPEQLTAGTIVLVGRLFCLLSAAGFGAMAVFGKLAYDAGVSVDALLLIRFGLAGGLLITIALAVAHCANSPAEPC